MNDHKQRGKHFKHEAELMKARGVPEYLAQRMDGKDRNDCPFCEETEVPLLKHLRKAHTSKKRPDFKALHAYAETISQKRQKK